MASKRYQEQLSSASPIKRWSKFAALAAITSLLLTACGGPSTDGGSKAEVVNTDWSKISPASEITYWSNHPGSSIEIEKELIKRFNEKHPDIKVNLVTAGASYDEVASKFQAASAGSNAPDLVIASDVWWFRYYINNQLMPLTDVMNYLGADLGDYNDTFLGDYTYENDIWAMPYARSTPIFYYNKEAWLKAGLPDRGPKTWEEMMEWSPKLAESNGTESGLVLSTGTSWSGWWFMNINWGFGGQFSDEFDMTMTSDATVAAGEFLRKQVNEEKNIVISTNATQDFLAGAFPATVQSTGSLRGILDAATFEVGTAFLPDGPSGGGVPTGGTGIGISSKSTPEKQLAAATFLAFITNAENTAYFAANTGYIPVRDSASQTQTTKSVIAKFPQFQTAIDQLAQKSKSQDWVRVFVPSGDKLLTDAIEEILVKNTPAEVAFSAINPQLEAAYQENVAPYLK